MKLKKVRTATLAVALSAAMAGPAFMATSIAVAPQANAFGWSDIKKGAKKVGGTAKKVGKAAASNAKDLGGALKRDVKKAGSTIERGAKTVGGAVKKGAKYAGKGVKEAVKVTGKVAKGTANAGLAVASEGAKLVVVGGGTLIVKGLGKFDAEAKRRAEKLRNDIDKAFTVDGIGRGVKKGGKWVGKQAKKSAIVRGVIKDAKAVGSGIKKIAGKLRATAKVPPERKGSRSSTGHQTGNFKTGVVSDKSFRGVNTKSVAPGRMPYWKKYRENPGNTKDIQTRKRGDRQVVGRDKSVFGRPVGVKKQRKVQGIRLKDSNKRKHSKLRITGRDKSVFGRPVGVKKRDRKMRNRSRHAEKGNSEKNRSKRF